MPRSPLWLWLVASGLACALSVDDPEGVEPDMVPAAPFQGNPFGFSSPSIPPYNGGGNAGASAGYDDGPAESGGGSGEGSERGGRAGERLSPLNLPVPDAAAPQCPADAGACDDALCLSNDDCYAGLCVNARCRSFCDADADCQVGEACALGLCRTTPGGTWECFDARDCVVGEDCVSGSCLSRCTNDDHCAGTDDGPVCSFGYCGQ